MALTIRPEVKLLLQQWPAPGPDGIWQEGPLAARVIVLGPGPWGTGGVFPARDVVLQFNLASGRQGSRSLPVLDPNADRYARTEPYLEVEIDTPSDDWPPPQGDHVDVFALFTDSRGLEQYRVSMAADLRRTDNPAAVSILITKEATTTRIGD